MLVFEGPKIDCRIEPEIPVLPPHFVFGHGPRLRNVNAAKYFTAWYIALIFLSFLRAVKLIVSDLVRRRHPFTGFRVGKIFPPSYLHFSQRHRRTSRPIRIRFAVLSHPGIQCILFSSTKKNCTTNISFNRQKYAARVRQHVRGSNIVKYNLEAKESIII